MENMKLTLISVNGRSTFVWMPDKNNHGGHGYGSNGKCWMPASWLTTLFGIGKGEGVVIR